MAHGVELGQAVARRPSPRIIQTSASGAAAAPMAKPAPRPACRRRPDRASAGARAQHRRRWRRSRRHRPRTGVVAGLVVEGAQQGHRFTIAPRSAAWCRSRSRARGRARAAPAARTSAVGWERIGQVASAGRRPHRRSRPRPAGGSGAHRARAAVDPRSAWRVAHVPAVVEPEVAGHAAQQHAVGFARRLAALVAHLQWVGRAPAGRAPCRSGRPPSRSTAAATAGRVGGAGHGPAADHHQRRGRRRPAARRAPESAPAPAWQGHRPARRHAPGAGEHALHAGPGTSAAPLGQANGRARRRRVPLADAGLS